MQYHSPDRDELFSDNVGDLRQTMYSVRISTRFNGPQERFHDGEMFMILRRDVNTNMHLALTRFGVRLICEASVTLLLMSC
jgi:hypothetical protein